LIEASARNSVPYMPDYRRWYAPGSTYFFTVVTYDRAPILCEPFARECLRASLRECRERWPFENIAFVLLPDHLHAIWSLASGDANFSRRWAWVKREFTRRWIQQHEAASLWQRRRSVWQPRFWEHLIRDEKDFANHLDYIHYNPVKHGHAGSPREWPYSSFHRFVKLGWYEPEWGAGLTLPDLKKTVGE
jgi:putative transposase